ncbi:MAG: TrkH family potassium uptake protein [Clostridiales bacterium]|nr:TrkH family potassium uptake protein [Clostridiales bacterium]
MAKMKDCSNRGKLMVMIGLLVIAPVAILPFYPRDIGYAIYFLLPGLLSILTGGLVCAFGKRETYFSADRLKTQQHSNNTVLFTWFWGIIVGAMPFFLSGQLKLVQAIFESVSGWTTTGLSVMDVTQTSKIFLFYRSFMQYCGGLGFVLMMVMLVSGKRSMDLFNAEGHPDKLMPNLKQTAQTIFEMYIIFLILGTAAYVVCGMPLFDSLCHAMCSLSTGGFSTKLNSIGEYHSLPIEIITTLLMLIGTTNFAVMLLLLRGKWRKAFQVSEVRFLFLLLFLFVPLMALSLSGSMGFGAGLRHALFNAASALSTTGYATMSYENWPSFTIGLMILLMLIGGGIGSTAGGLKLTRVYLILRMIGLNVKRKLLSQRCVDAPTFVKAQGRTKIDGELCSDTVGFVGCYLLLFLAGAQLLTLTAGCGLETAMFEFASALGTVGLSIGLTGPMTNNATLIVEMIGMILGRLEIFIVLTGFYSWLHGGGKIKGWRDSFIYPHLER